jgi:hypothetical protein
MEQVNTFKTSDGKYFESQEDAEKHEEQLNVAEMMKKRKAIIKEKFKKFNPNQIDALAYHFDDLISAFMEAGVD